jgi:hypothetical protein
VIISTIRGSMTQVSIAFLLGAVWVCDSTASSEPVRRSAHDCDTLAAHPSDPDRVGAGVVDGRLKPAAAIAACQVAIRENPEVARFHFQLSRAYWLSSDPAKRTSALEHLRIAVDLGSPAALGHLGEVMAGKGRVTSVDIPEALDLLDRAISGGYRPAAAVVSRLKSEIAAGNSSGLGAEGRPNPRGGRAPLTSSSEIPLSYYSTATSIEDLGVCAEMARSINSRTAKDRSALNVNDVDNDELLPRAAEVCLATVAEANQRWQLGVSHNRQAEERMRSAAESGSFRNPNPSMEEGIRNIVTIFSGLSGVGARLGGMQDTKFRGTDFRLVGCARNFGGGGVLCDYFIRLEVTGSGYMGWLGSATGSYVTRPWKLHL